MKKSEDQQTGLDFERMVKAWEENEITRDQLAKYLEEQGHDAEWVIESLEHDRRQEIVEKIKQAIKRRDMGEAQEFSELLYKLDRKYE